MARATRCSLALLCSAATRLVVEAAPPCADCARAAEDDSSLLATPGLPDIRQSPPGIRLMSSSHHHSDHHYQRRCREWVDKAPHDIRDELDICSGPVVRLKNKHFEQGTYMITQPGIYVLHEDITFEPKTPRMFPPKGSATYTPEKGFFLGFFAGISIAADRVMIDLNGHTFKVSDEFLMRQRFYKHILLANLPFMPGTGPPQFQVLEGPLVSANNVAIVDGTLGLSSHMGIHGNNNENVWVSHVQIRDFETGGFQLNNGNNVHMTDCHVGPTLGAPGSSRDVPALATLSQSINLLQHVWGTPWEDQKEFRHLNHAVEHFIRKRLAGKDVGSESLFAAESWGYNGLPEGSAMYGIGVTPAGPAVGDFASVELCAEEENQMETLKLHNVTVRGLHLRTDEVVQLQDADGRPIMGPAGDVMQLWRCRDKRGEYDGNLLCDAQAALGQLALDHRHLLRTDPDKYFGYFGGVNVPKAVQDWVNGDSGWEDMLDDLGGEFVCGLDAMSHANKGVVAIRSECVSDIGFKDVHISNIHQVGKRSHYMKFCGNYYDLDAGQYHGVKARGIFITAPQWHKNRPPTNLVVEDVKATYGRAIGVQVCAGERAIPGETFAHGRITNIQGVNMEQSVLKLQTVR